MKQKSGIARRVWQAIGLGSVTMALWIAIAAMGPDQEVAMTRTVPSNFTADKIGAAIHFLSNWPRWHHFAKNAERLDFRDQPVTVADQYIVPGAIIRLTIDPKDKPWKRFTLKLEVVEYEPFKKVSLRLLEDSTGKIPRLLQNVGWSVEVVPGPGAGSTVRATVSGYTANWRARMFSRIAHRILLNQVLPADVVALGTIDHPSALNPASAYSQ